MKILEDYPNSLPDWARASLLFDTFLSISDNCFKRFGYLKRE